MLGERSSVKELIKFYDQVADQSRRAPINHYAFRQHDLAALSPLLYVEKIIAERRCPGSQLFLDLCCGTGICSIYPAKLGYEVHGVDLSSVSIEAARWLAQVNEVGGNCSFELKEALEYLRSTNLQFDVIFMRGSLYYFDLDEALPVIVQRLKAGGTFLCIETNGSNFLMNSIRRLINAFRGHRDPSTLNSLLRRNAFYKLAAYFDSSQTQFFDCFALGFIFLSWNKSLSRWFHTAAQELDYFFLNTLGFSHLAFKVVFKGEISFERRPKSIEFESCGSRRTYISTR